MLNEWKILSCCLVFIGILSAQNIQGMKLKHLCYKFFK